MIVNFGDTLEAAFLPLLHFLNGFEDVLLWLPWYLVVAGFGGLAWSASRS